MIEPVTIAIWQQKEQQQPLLIKTWANPRILRAKIAKVLKGTWETRGQATTELILTLCARDSEVVFGQGVKPIPADAIIIDFISGIVSETATGKSKTLRGWAKKYA